MSRISARSKYAPVNRWARRKRIWEDDEDNEEEAVQTDPEKSIKSEAAPPRSGKH